MKLKEIIQEYKNKTGKTDAEIARSIGVDRSTVTRWAKGDVKKVSAEIRERLSEMLGYDITPLLLGMNTNAKLPILGYVKAGYNLYAEENYLGEEETTIRECQKGDFYLKVSGNSMMGAGIMNDSLVLVQKCSQVSDGDIAVVLIENEVTVKRVYRKKGLLILEAANPDVENRYFTSAEIKDLPVTILGKVLSCKTYF